MVFPSNFFFTQLCRRSEEAFFPTPRSKREGKGHEFRGLDSRPRDKAVPSANGFWPLLRRHHCRVCGRILARTALLHRPGRRVAGPSPESRIRGLWTQPPVPTSRLSSAARPQGIFRNRWPTTPAKDACVGTAWNHVDDTLRHEDVKHGSSSAWRATALVPSRRRALSSASRTAACCKTRPWDFFRKQWRGVQRTLPSTQANRSQLSLLCGAGVPSRTPATLGLATSS